VPPHEGKHSIGTCPGCPDGLEEEAMARTEPGIYEQFAEADRRIEELQEQVRELREGLRLLVREAAFAAREPMAHTVLAYALNKARALLEKHDD
jgi:hypothetical protein